MTALAIAMRRVRIARRSDVAAETSGAWLLSAAMVASGVLTYAFHVLAARSLGASAYGQIAVLWGAMFLVAIVLFRPIEQTTSRALADRLTRGEEVRSVTRAAVTIALLLLAAVGLVAALAWQPISNRLFLGSDSMTALLAAGIAAYGLAYVVRGLLGGTRWFAGYGIGLLADGAVRLAVALPLLVVASRLTAAVAVVAAGVAGALVPLALGRKRLAIVVAHGTGAPFRLPAAFAFAAPASVIAGVDQLLVNGGPLLVIAGGGHGASHEAGIVFAATMLVRAPVYVFQGVAAALLPNLTHMHANADWRRLRSAVVKTAGFLLACGGLIAAAMAAVGPESMRFLYGSEFTAGRIDLVLLGAGIGFYLAGSTVSQALLALDRGNRAALAWAVSGVTFVVVYALVAGSDLERVSIGFSAATGLCLALLSAQFLAGTRR